MDFVLFLLTTAALLVRPAELVTALQGLPIYQALSLSCAACAAPAILRQLAPRSLRSQPVTACVVTMQVAVTMSHLSHFYLSGAWDALVGFSYTILLYYLLLVGTVNTPRRLRVFLQTFVGLMAVNATLSVLQYHGFVNIEAISVLEDLLGYDAATGQRLTVLRLRGSGLFNDPNDFCNFLVASLLLAFYFLGDRGAGPLRLAWLGPVAVCGYAVVLTRSRGGLLALMTGLGVLFSFRFGWRKALPLLVLILPALLLGVGGRQASLSTGEGTAHERIELWRQGFALFRGAPLFGIGQGRYADEVGLVAHNSYLHCFTELGFLGGTAFAGMFACSLLSLARVWRASDWVEDDGLRRLPPYIAAAASAYAVGLFSLTRCYVLPTYIVIGLTPVYVTSVAPYFPCAVLTADRALMTRLAALGLLIVAIIYVFTKTA